MILYGIQRCNPRSYEREIVFCYFRVKTKVRFSLFVHCCKANTVSKLSDEDKESSSRKKETLLQMSQNGNEAWQFRTTHRITLTESPSQAQKKRLHSTPQCLLMCYSCQFMSCYFLVRFKSSYQVGVNFSQLHNICY